MFRDRLKSVFEKHVHTPVSFCARWVPVDGARGCTLTSLLSKRDPPTTAHASVQTSLEYVHVDVDVEKTTQI